MRQNEHQLLTAVARRRVGLTRGLAQYARNLLEHHVALLVSVGVVERLEVVNVEQDQSDRIVVAADLLHLGPQELLKTSVIGKTGQLVGYCLATHLDVELDVLERERGL